MGFGPLIEVISKILREPIPDGVNPILALGKTDKERLNAKEKTSLSGLATDTTYDTTSSNNRQSQERRRWLREAYKAPLAAAGLTHSRTSLNRPVNRVTGDIQREKIEWERARERRLRSQATRGVIALFNSVKKHQSMISKHMDRTDLLPTQKEKIFSEITTADFLDRLSAGLPKAKHAKQKESDDPVAKPSRQGSIPTLRTTFGRAKKRKAPDG